MCISRAGTNVECLGPYTGHTCPQLGMCTNVTPTPAHMFTPILMQVHWITDHIWPLSCTYSLVCSTCACSTVGIGDEIYSGHRLVFIVSTCPVGSVS